MFVSVIIPVYQDLERLMFALESLAKQTLSKELWEVIVVNNDSSSDVVLPSFVFQCKVVDCKEPGSYAARNKGIRASKGDLLVFTDADCRPSNRWLENYYKLFLNLGMSHICAGAVSVQKFESGPANIYEKYDMIVGIPQEHYALKKGYGVTANLAVPRSIVADAGEFDSTRFSGGDAEFCLRAKRCGYETIYNAHAVVAHPARSTWSELEIKARRVKGGQIKAGPIKRRIFYILIAPLMPCRLILKIFSSDADIFSKVQSSFVVLRLFATEVTEMGKLIFGSEAERR